MSDPKTVLRRDTGPKKLKHITEECAELIKAIVKAETFGMFDCYYETDNKYPGETNEEAITREIADVRLAIHRWEQYRETTTHMQRARDFEIK